MDKNITDYLNLIKESIHKSRSFEAYDYSNTEWDTIVKMAIETSMHGIVFKRLKEIAKADPGLNEAVSELEPVIIRYGISEVRKRKLVKEIMKIARDEGIPVLLFKGVVLSSLYPEPSMRFSSDTDMFINESERSRMVDIFLQRGYVFDKEGSNADVVKYLLPKQHYIELHSKLWSYYRGSKVEKIAKMKLEENHIHGIYDGVECDTIDYGEQLVFLMFHLCKHLICEHANIRFLTDIALFFNAHYKEMDLALLKERMQILEYWEFFSLIYEISIRYLGFERIPEMESIKSPEYKESQAEATISELMLVGRDKFDNDNLNRLDYNMTPYLMGTYAETENHGKFRKRLNYLFPSVKHFPDGYGYVKKCPILLPVGWIHRIGKYAIDRMFKKTDRISGTVRMNKVDAKVERLRKIGLIK